MSKIKLCCLVDPIPPNGVLTLFDNPKEIIICKQCYSDLLNEIPEAVRNTEAKGVWEAMINFIDFKLKTDHCHDA